MKKQWWLGKKMKVAVTSSHRGFDLLSLGVGVLIGCFIVSITYLTMHKSDMLSFPSSMFLVFLPFPSFFFFKKIVSFFSYIVWTFSDFSGVNNSGCMFFDFSADWWGRWWMFLLFYACFWCSSVFLQFVMQSPMASQRFLMSFRAMELLQVKIQTLIRHSSRTDFWGNRVKIFSLFFFPFLC